MIVSVLEYFLSMKDWSFQVVSCGSQRVSRVFHEKIKKKNYKFCS